MLHDGILQRQGKNRDRLITDSNFQVFRVSGRIAEFNPLNSGCRGLQGKRKITWRQIKPEEQLQVLGKET